FGGRSGVFERTWRGGFGAFGNGRGLVGSLLGVIGGVAVAGQFGLELIAFLPKGGELDFHAFVAFNPGGPRCFQLFGESLGGIQTLVPFGFSAFLIGALFFQVGFGSFQLGGMPLPAGFELIGMAASGAGRLLFGGEPSE